MPAASKNKISTYNNIGEEIAEVIAKIQLIEGDRKAFAESSNYTQKTNDAKIRSLRVENKELIQNYKNCISCDDETLNIVFPGHDTGKQQFVGRLPEVTIQGLINKKCDQIKRLNLAQYQTRQKEKSLIEMIDKMRGIHAFAERMSKAYLDPLCQKGRNRMTSTDIEKYKVRNIEGDETVTAFAKLARMLGEESKCYEDNLFHLERAIQANEDDLQSLIEMHRDAENSKELAKRDLHLQEEDVAKEKREREKKRLNLKKIGDHRQNEMDKLKTMVKKDEPTVPESEGSTALLQEERQAKADSEEKRIGKIERAQQKVQDATGLTSTQQAIKYFRDQLRTKENLEAQIEDQAEQIANLEQRKRELQANFDEVKYEGVADYETRRSFNTEIIPEASVDDETEDETEENLNNVRMSITQNKLNGTRKTTTDLKTALDHIYAKLSALKTLKRPRHSLWEKRREHEYLVDVANILVDKISMLVAEIGKDTDVNQVGQEIDDSDFNYVVQNKLTQMNARVSTRSSRFRHTFDDEEEEINESEEEDVMTRTQIKRQSKAIIDSRMNRGSNKKAAMKFR
ncbi:outer dynein arm-docking complex subunit 3-like [Convolutriloba macropyga]|uniref:outer dynein arm-docking complex subunit 3-like n=1 Tax=Convolutriloba macropyga TaxID=536237 RepID=UPI003F523DC9